MTLRFADPASGAREIDRVLDDRGIVDADLRAGVQRAVTDLIALDAPTEREPHDVEGALRSLCERLFAAACEGVLSSAALQQRVRTHLGTIEQ